MQLFEPEVDELPDHRSSFRLSKHRRQNGKTRSSLCAFRRFRGASSTHHPARERMIAGFAYGSSSSLGFIFATVTLG